MWVDAREEEGRLELGVTRRLYVFCTYTGRRTAGYHKQGGKVDKKIDQSS